MKIQTTLFLTYKTRKESLTAPTTEHNKRFLQNQSHTCKSQCIEHDFLPVKRKTHLATSIDITTAKKCTSTYFIKCHDLLQNLKRANTVISVLGKSYRIKDHFNKENE